MLLPTLSLHPKRLHVDLMICRSVGLSSSLKSMMHSCWDLCMPPFRRILIYTKQQVPRKTRRASRVSIYNHYERWWRPWSRKSEIGAERSFKGFALARSASQLSASVEVSNHQGRTRAIYLFSFKEGYCLESAYCCCRWCSLRDEWYSFSVFAFNWPAIYGLRLWEWLATSRTSEIGSDIMHNLHLSVADTALNRAAECREVNLREFDYHLKDGRQGEGHEKTASLPIAKKYTLIYFQVAGHKKVALSHMANFMAVNDSQATSCCDLFEINKSNQLAHYPFLAKNEIIDRIESLNNHIMIECTALFYALQNLLHSCFHEAISTLL